MSHSCPAFTYLAERKMVDLCTRTFFLHFSSFFFLYSSYPSSFVLKLLHEHRLLGDSWQRYDLRRIYSGGNRRREGAEQGEREGRRRIRKTIGKEKNKNRGRRKKNRGRTRRTGGKETNKNREGKQKTEGEQGEQEGMRRTRTGEGEQKTGREEQEHGKENKGNGGRTRRT